MQKHAGTTLFSASDLVGFLECEHLTTLQLQDLNTPLERAEDDDSARLIQAFASKGSCWTAALYSANARSYSPSAARTLPRLQNAAA